MTEIYNAADEEVVLEAKRTEKRDAKAADRDLLSVMSSAEGQRVIWRILGEAGIHRTSFNTNALTMASLEGRRSLGLWLESEICRVSQEKYLEMQNRAYKEGK